jgi:enoyl-[acyl-carrier-protein] reductase (NADH)
LGIDSLKPHNQLEFPGRVRSTTDRVGVLHDEGRHCASDQSLAVEWGKYNITVNAVAPTFIRTPGTESCLANPSFRADVIERIAALHRIGEPMEVAGVIVFLASSAASLITGETILIDGGWTAR